MQTQRDTETPRFQLISAAAVSHQLNVPKMTEPPIPPFQSGELSQFWMNETRLSFFFPFSRKLVSTLSLM